MSTSSSWSSSANRLSSRRSRRFSTLLQSQYTHTSQSIMGERTLVLCHLSGSLEKQEPKLNENDGPKSCRGTFLRLQTIFFMARRSSITSRWASVPARCRAADVSLQHIVFVDAYFIPFARHHRFISFMLYTLGFVGFVTNLKRNQLRRQFGLFCWIHMSLLLVVVSSHFIVNNILEGIIWLWVPASLVIMNDIAAYVWGGCTRQFTGVALMSTTGMLFGRTQLIKLSPKKTVEGFVGAFFTTVVFAYFVSGLAFDHCARLTFVRAVGHPLHALPIHDLSCYRLGYDSVLGRAMRPELGFRMDVLQTAFRSLDDLVGDCESSLHSTSVSLTWNARRPPSTSLASRTRPSSCMP